MVDLQLYTLVLPQAGQADAQPQQNQQLSKHGLLDRDSGNVERVATEPGSQTLSGRYMGQYAEKMAAELEELACAGIGPLPLAGQTEHTPLQGYYEIEGVNIPPVNPKARNLYRYELSLAKEGTRESKRRSVATTIQQVENDFGNDQTAYLGVPAAALDAEWADRESEQTEPATVIETRTAELGAVEIYDAQASSFNRPALVFDIPYLDEEDVDVRIWDTRNLSAKLDTDGALQWMKVFSTPHEFVGEPIVGNGLVRLTLDTTDGLTVEEYDASTETWAAVALGTSDWELDAWDVARISPTRVDVQTRFVDPTQDPTASFTLDMSLKRGYEWPQWVVPPSEDPPTPAGLLDLLGPVANESDYSPQAEQGLVDRGEVRA